MNNLVIANIGISQDEAGRYSLNDLHKASGGEQKHRPKYWLENQQTIELVNELIKGGNTPLEQNQPVSVIHGGNNRGTYVCKELVYSYAMWIRPDFHLKVIRTFDAIATGKPLDPIKVLNDPETMRGLLLTYSEKVISLQNENSELKPKAVALDRIANTDGSMCVTDAAKHLNVQPKFLFNFLSCHSWTYRRLGNRNWVGYQDKIQQGLLEHKVVILGTDEYGADKTADQVRITKKGLTKLSEMLSVSIAN